MKDRTREAVFNLVGPSVKGKHAIDLFAGTGAMAIEAISRGAHSAMLIERHLPSARLVRENLATLNLTDKATLFEADAFIWMQDKSDELPRDQPWLTFICPPYRFFRERFDDMLTIVTWFAQNSPPNSIMMVEAEIPFDFEQFASLGEWNVRTYRPAVVGKLA